MTFDPNTDHALVMPFVNIAWLYYPNEFCMAFFHNFGYLIDKNKYVRFYRFYHISILHECEGGIEKSVPRSPIGITRLAE